MTHALREYQAEAVTAAIDWMRQSIEPFVIDAATGAGKSHIIAAIAADIHKRTGKRVLCLAPSAELIVQNREKYLATGAQASVFSASAGAKDLRHPVVFGSPLTVKNRISRFGKEYGLVVIDEAHGLTPTVRDIIAAMKESNPNLRVCGLSATPYRLGTGYIYAMQPDGKVNPPSTCRDPYFTKCVYRVGARDLISQGFLTKPTIGATGTEGYDTAALTLNSRGQFDAEAVDRAYHGHGRKTAAIVADVVAKAQDKRGVMFFAATVRHAQEVLASLPPEMSALVTGETPKAERDSILRRFKAQSIKYIVNVSVLTVGFDAPHVDLIAILRKTESIGLLQQIIGRGLRISPGKAECLVLDYTTNLQDHCPDGDLFAPIIKASKGGGDGGMLECVCPVCAYENSFTAHKDYLDARKDSAGYVLDLDGQQVMTEWGPVPGHHGRRCMNMLRTGLRGEYERCSYRWTSKPCPACDAPNDIAARYCCECRAEIIDPNEKLIGEFQAMKRDPTQRQTDEVVKMDCKPGISGRGNRTIRVEWVTKYRQFTTWVQPDAANSRGMRDFAVWNDATQGGEDTPKTVSYVKDAETGFFRIWGYNRKADHAPG